MPFSLYKHLGFMQYHPKSWSAVMFSRSLILFMMLPHDDIVEDGEVEVVVDGQLHVVAPVEHVVVADPEGVLGAPVGVPLKCRLQSG